ncbi:hypothetical protein IQ266_04815 [filamentous cyanobacterium LEGE 11480]|uniref:Glycosyltransferase RgtA/B/C/D-like domain-containing protein n=1 Tax=Romeriopsis navalis LEGE 11480 TaxID=2777977 RepID=A0A928VK21_9CYAN|nr:hypothetical protein [Romeriopsis navalis]MBE9029082.1 hypothetical protein [Romeriopsis navalis LEGE 11480]
MVSAKPHRGPRWLMPVVVALLIFGIGLRFTHLDQKVYWYDEVSTLLSVSGNSELDIVQDFADLTEPVSPDFLQTYQQFKPDSNSQDTIERLIQENPHHPPLYYLLGRQWGKVFGLTPVSLRGLAVVISLGSFPFAYWLCQELFAMPTVSWMAVALMAISPLHLAYAQEARQYSLWMTLVLGSSAVFLWAMRCSQSDANQTRSPLGRVVSLPSLSWGLYSLLLILGFYTQLFFGLVALGHGLYALGRWAGWVYLPSDPVAPIDSASARPGGRWGYFTASAIALLAFTPWLWVVFREFQNADRLTIWTREYAPTRLGMVKIWLHNLSLSFFDTGLERFSQRLIPAYLAFALLLFYGVYHLSRKAPTASTLFILALMGTTALPLFLPDLLLGGRRTIMPRYLLPFYLSVQITVAYLLGSKIAMMGQQAKSKAWTLATGVLLGAGILSFGAYSQADVWWTKSFNIDNVAVAEIINRSDRPLLINNGPVPFAISQTYHLKTETGVLLEPYCTNCQQDSEGRGELNIPEISDEIAAQFSDRFLLNSYSSKDWTAQLAEWSGGTAKLRYQGRVSQLWELLP